VGAGIRRQVGKLIRLDPTGLDLEVHVILGAERLHQVDLRPEGHTAAAGIGTE